MRSKRIISILTVIIACLLLGSSYSSNNISTNNTMVVDRSPKTSAAPTFSIDSPSNYSLFGKLAPNYSLTITEGNFTWYDLGVGVNSTPIELEGTPNENIEEPFNQTMWDSLDNGTATVRFYVNNSLGELGYLDAILRIDFLDPIINIIAPTGGFFNSTNPDFNIEISEPNLNTTWYTLNTNQTKHIFTSNGTIDGWEYLNDELITITFYANDSVNNENSDLVQITKDTTNPGVPTSLIADPLSWTNTDSFDLYWTNPVDLSGVVGAYYKLGAAPLSDTDGIYVAGTDIESILGISVSSDAVHDVYVWLNDSVGNINYLNYNSTQLYLDTSAPSIPLVFEATPDSWTNTDSFNLYWTNPVDLSGVVGAYYKLGAAPLSDTDGIYVAGTDIESILGISVSSDSVHDVYVWLNDSVGNINYLNYNSTQLYLDTTAPSIPLDFTSTPDSWTNTDSFDLYWTNPADLSGIVGAYYKLDTVPLTNTDGTYVAGTDIESILGISVSSDGVHDVYIWLNDSVGNINYLNYNSTQLYLDTSAPSIPLVFEATPDSWTNTDSFDLYWTNPVDLSGVVGAYYKLDTVPLTNTDGTYVAGTDIESILGISVSSDSVHDVYVWLNDSVGNINYLNYNSTQLYLDTSAPSIPLDFTSTPDSWTNTDSFDLYWTNPVDLSGVVGAYYKLGAAPLSDTDGTYVAGTDIESILGISVSSDGVHDVYVWLNDSVGNINYLNYNSTQLYLDTTAPSIPLVFGATPISWTNTDSFDLYWSNPSDDSGIVGAYYKLDSAPTTNTDGTYVAGTDIESILGISVSSDGVHDVYVWLNDSVGNINYLNYNSTQLYLDTTAPSIPLVFEATPDSWTNVNSFDLSWTNPVDLSGVVGAYYKLGAAPLSDTDGIYVAGTDIESILGISVSSDGVHDVYVWLNDSVGNIDRTNFANTQLHLDTTNPILILNSPLNNTSWDSRPSINITVYELNLAFLKYTVIDYFPTDNWITDKNNTEVSLNPDIWDDLTQGAFQIEFTCFDDLGQSSILTITLYKDTNAPSITINSPVNNTFWNSIPSLNITAIDPNLDTIWYKVGITNITLSSGIEELLNGSIWDDLEEGPFNIEIFANDTFGHVNNSYVLTLYKDIITPSLIIILPINGTIYDSQPSINVTVFDSYFDTLWYRVGNTNITLTNNTEEFLNLAIWDSLPEEGAFFIYFYANDSVGNLNNTLVLTLYKDIKAPIIDIISPQSNRLFGENSPSVSLNVTDANLEEVWYQLSNGTVTTDNYTWTGSLNQAVWEQVGNGTVTIRFYANDTFNHLGFAEVTVRKNIEKPIILIEDPPENELFGLIAPNVTIYKSGTELNTTWYTIDYGVTNYTFFGLNVVINQTAWDNYGFADVIIKFYINDSLGKIGFDEITLRKDPDPPEVTITFIDPLNYSYCDVEPTFNITVYDPNLVTIWYRVGSTNITIFNDPVLDLNNTVITLNDTIWNSLSQGIFTIEVFAVDILGYLNDSMMLTFFKDTLAPGLVINQPDDYYYNSPPPINITVYDPNFVPLSLTYTFGLIPIAPITLYNNTEDFLNQTVWNSLPQGEFLVSITAKDTFDHSAFIVLTLYKDTIAPTVVVNLPLDYSYWNTHPIINIAAIDPNLHTIWYRVGITNITLTNSTDQPLDGGIWDSLTEESFNIEIFANDSSGYICDPITLTLYKDLTPPSININSPNNNTYYGLAPDILLIATDVSVDSIWYTVGATKILLDSGVSKPLDSSIWNSLPSEGQFIINFYANDTAGNINNTYTLTLYKDVVTPSLTIDSPVNNTYWNVEPDIQVTASDTYFDSVWYTVGATKILLESGVSELFDSSIWSSLPDEGQFTLNFFANDTTGNINNTYTLTLYKDVVTPSLSIDMPANNTHWNSIPDIQVTAPDTYLDSVWYTVGATKILLDNGVSESFDSSIWNSLPNEGFFTINFFANDSAGNLNDGIILTLYKDTVAPLVTVNLPLNNTYWRVEPVFNIAAYDPNLFSISYQVVGYPERFLLNNTDTPLVILDWLDLPVDIFFVDIFAEDLAGNINDSIRLTLYKDTVEPVIDIILPQSNDIYGDIPPSFEISVTEDHLNTTWYTLIGESTIIQFTGFTGTIDETTWDLFGNETVTIRFYANDTADNKGFKDITVQKNIFAPIITINSPGNNDLFGIAAPNYLIYKSGSLLNSTWYTLDNGITNMTFTGLSGTINRTVWDNFGLEIITLRFYINDSFGKIGFDEVSIRKDPDMPIIIINSPTNHAAFASSPFINLTIIEPNLDKVWYRMNSIIIYITDNVTQFFDFSIWNSLPQGDFNVELFANDTMGNINYFNSLNLSKDTIAPNITIIQPAENQKVGRNAPLFDLLIDDENGVDISWYTIGGGEISRQFTDLTGIIDQNSWEQIWDNLTQGAIITIRFYAKDTLGNENFVELNLIVEKPLELPKFLSNPLGLLLPTLGLVVMIPLTIRLTKGSYYKALNNKNKKKFRKVLITAGFFLSLLTLYFIF